MTLNSYLGDELMEVRREGSREMHRRSFYHLELLGTPPQRWRHYEDHASDSSPPIEFELYWMPVAPLRSCQGDKASTCATWGDCTPTLSYAAANHCPALSQSAQRSPIMMVVQLVLARITLGITEASATLIFSSP